MSFAKPAIQRHYYSQKRPTKRKQDEDIESWVLQNVSQIQKDYQLYFRKLKLKKETPKKKTKSKLYKNVKSVIAQNLLTQEQAAEREYRELIGMNQGVEHDVWYIANQSVLDNKSNYVLGVPTGPVTDQHLQVQEEDKLEKYRMEISLQRQEMEAIRQRLDKEGKIFQKHLPRTIETQQQQLATPHQNVPKVKYKSPEQANEDIRLAMTKIVECSKQTNKNFFDHKQVYSVEEDSAYGEAYAKSLKSQSWSVRSSRKSEMSAKPVSTKGSYKGSQRLSHKKPDVVPKIEIHPPKKSLHKNLLASTLQKQANETVRSYFIAPDVLAKVQPLVDETAKHQSVKSLTRPASPVVLGLLQDTQISENKFADHSKDDQVSKIQSEFNHILQFGLVPTKKQLKEQCLIKKRDKAIKTLMSPKSKAAHIQSPTMRLIAQKNQTVQQKQILQKFNPFSFHKRVRPQSDKRI